MKAMEQGKLLNMKQVAERFLNQLTTSGQTLEHYAKEGRPFSLIYPLLSPLAVQQKTRDVFPKRNQINFAFWGHGTQGHQMHTPCGMHVKCQAVRSSLSEQRK